MSCERAVDSDTAESSREEKKGKEAEIYSTVGLTGGSEHAV